MNLPPRKRIRINAWTLLLLLINETITITFSWWMNNSIDSIVALVTMKSALFILVFYLFRYQGATVDHSIGDNELNKRPIVGVLTQEQSYYLHGKYPEENYTSYIAASYVKDIESSGARVVPIMIGRKRDYYEDIMSKINGVFFPGGATYFNQSDGYADAGQHIYEIAQELNDAGNYFPVFGTCLGFELILILASGRGEKENRVTCRSFENLPLEFTDDFRKSRMFSEIPERVYEILANEYVTVNQHQFCITDYNMEAYNLTENWRIMSYNHDENGLEFISTVEHKRYPIYGIQFHPEKGAFEWEESKNYPHSRDAIYANRYFMDFFVDECRRNKNKFADVAEEQTYLIFNYEAKHTGALGIAYEQCYLFEPRGIVA